MSSWDTSNRRDRLPPDWPRIRKRILKRDRHICQHEDDYHGLCGEPATEVDHIRAGDDHRDVNLQALCTWHHKRKSSREGNAARSAKRREIDRRFRTVEEHPGFL